LPNPGDIQLTQAHTLLQNDPDSTDYPKAVQLLWQAVEKGNSTAEIELASLYLAGRGVSKSCSQARVLLAAAQTHSNALAEQKLQNLSLYGCDPAADTPDRTSNDSPTAIP
jgi:TPR repeat protein